MGVPVSRRQQVYKRAVAREVPQTQQAQLAPVMAPIGGLNYRDSVATMPLADAIRAQNLLMRTNGVQLRDGWKEWCLAVTDGLTTAVRTIMPYVSATGSIDNKLFAAVGTKIYDITVTSATPSVSITPAGASSSGIWSHTMHSNTDDKTFLCAVNNGAGFYTYDVAGGWVARVLTGGPTNVNNITSVTSCKNRLWFTFDNRTDVWYLAIGAISGALTKFPLGPLLTKGGVLQACTTWTKDSAGQDIQDAFVAFGAQGNVLIYNGTDPSSATTWSLVGNWDLGAFPKNSHFFVKRDADINVLSSRGITSLSAVLAGQFSDENGNDTLSMKINNALVPALNTNFTADGWELRILPRIDTLLIIQPKGSDGINTQWAQSLTTGAWSNFDGVEITCSAVHDRSFYFGLSDGRVAIGFESGYDTDGQLLDGTAGAVIQADVQPAFNPFGTPGLLKTFHAARLIFIAPAAPSVAVRMNTQFNVEAAPGSPSFTTPSGSRWDSALWDSGRWAGLTSTFEVWAGITGVGYFGSLRMTLRGLPGTAWAAAHIMYVNGDATALM